MVGPSSRPGEPRRFIPGSGPCGTRGSKGRKLAIVREENGELVLAAPGFYNTGARAADGAQAVSDPVTLVALYSSPPSARVLDRPDSGQQGGHNEEDHAQQSGRPPGDKPDEHERGKQRDPYPIDPLNSAHAYKIGLGNAKKSGSLGLRAEALL